MQGLEEDTHYRSLEEEVPLSKLTPSTNSSRKCKIPSVKEIEKNITPPSLEMGNVSLKKDKVGKSVDPNNKEDKEIKLDILLNQY